MRFGGHRSAAGVTIATERVAEFAARFNAVAAAQLTQDDLVPELRVDLEFRSTRSTTSSRRCCGTSSPAASRIRRPLFVARGVTRRGAAASRRQGWSQASSSATMDASSSRSAGAWGRAPSELDVGDVIDVAFRLERDEWNGESRLQARFADFRISLGVRIVAGRWRGRRIDAPCDERVRPTGDRVREAWMSIVNPWLAGARVLDLFAGSGALGLEALSRGAEVVDFVELAPKNLALIRKNADTLGAGAARRDPPRGCLRFVEKLTPHAYDVAFADPPYDWAWHRSSPSVGSTFRSPTSSASSIASSETLPGDGDRRIRSPTRPRST